MTILSLNYVTRYYYSKKSYYSNKIKFKSAFNMFDSMRIKAQIDRNKKKIPYFIYLNHIQTLNTDFVYIYNLFLGEKYTQNN